MIPDFGESDVLHLNLPLKHILSDSLKRGDWPLWTPLLSSGFPILAEGQIGTFYLPNLVLFRFLPTVVAHNLNLVIVFLLSLLGMYLFCRSSGLSSLSATFVSIVFSFSGFFSVHLNHFNLIQASSIAPWLFWACLRLLKRPSLKLAILFAFFLSQQIFTGYLTIVFVCLVGLIIFAIINLAITMHCSMAAVVKRLGWFAFAVVLAIFLSSIQLFPTFELWQLSQRKAGLPFETVTSYPYPYKHLITFINPYAFGTPADGSYPPFNDNWGIFWENTAYIGVLPLIFALLSLFLIRNQTVKGVMLLLAISFLLVLGKFSPLYFLFSFPPFNLFRVPSRFLLLTVFALSILAGFTFEQIIKWFKRQPLGIKMTKAIKILLIILIFILALFDEYRFSYNYPPVSQANWWTAPPETADFLQGKTTRVATIGAAHLWNKVFLKEGWRNFSPYLYFRNSLYPNYNALFNIANIDINTGGLPLNRSLLFSLLTKEIEVLEERKIATVSALAKNSLSLASVDFFTSAYELTDPIFLEVKKIKPPINYDLNPIRIYKNNASLPRSYIAQSTQLVKTLEDVYHQLSQKDFLADEKILIEKTQTITKQNEGQEKNIPSSTTNILLAAETKVILETESANQGILVLTDTNYPGWRAYLDGQETEIFTVNFYQRGVLLPSGNHLVTFVFESDSFLWGKNITILSTFIVALVVFASSVAFPGTFFDRKRLFPHLYNKGQH